MESANLYQYHHLQQQFGGCSLAAQSGYGVSITHDTSPSVTRNSKDHNMLLNEIHPNLRELWPKNDFVVSPAKTSLIQDLGFCDPRSFAYQSANVLQLRKVKEEILDCFPKFSEHDQPYIHHHPSDENLWLSPFLSNGETGRQNLSAKELHSNAPSPARFGGVALSNSYNFSHVFPSTNISNQDLSLLASSSLGLNLPALDLLISTNHGKSCGQSSHDNFGLVEESMSLGHDYMQESSAASPSSSSNKASATRNEVSRAKRLYSLSEPKASHEPATKSRNISKFSCAPFKVRKEKLGDRIAALHRLVAPFGKTDTASVLTEAIGYIHFLQDQIQTLSVPYMKSPQSKPHVTIQQSSSMGGGEEVLLQDLRSRGLCLVPKSFTSYISSCSGRI